LFAWSAGPPLSEEEMMSVLALKAAPLAQGSVALSLQK
jgi:hypothetical protein